MLAAGNNRDTPVLLVFAGPNGSGKSTATRSMPAFGVYINADDLMEEYGLSDLEAAQQAEALRNKLLAERASFSFETVLSTERNLAFMQKAKDLGYEVQCIYVLTCSPDINAARVKSRVEAGGHDVPEEKIYGRYYRALALLPLVMSICDKMLVYDNSVAPALILRKDGAGTEQYPSAIWPKERLAALLGRD